jgi:nucleoside-diphosphate-sugar epimerase
VKALVTGASGFIGRRLVDRLAVLAGAANVIALARPAMNHQQALTLAHQRGLGVSVIEADLLDDGALAGVPPPADVVFHLAAEIDTAASDAALRVNDIGTRNLLRWLERAPSKPRVVYTSSVAVHDRTSAAIAPLSETSPLAPRTGYGRTKLVGETAVMNYPGAWVIARLPTVYGPGQKPGGLFDALEQGIARDTLVSRLAWPGRTSIIHVDDVVSVLITLGTHDECVRQAYCVASDEQLSIDDIANAIARATGRSRASVSLPALAWQTLRGLSFGPWIGVAPPSARIQLWRLSLMVSDGFLVDNAKLRRVHRGPLRTIDEGLRAGDDSLTRRA